MYGRVYNRERRLSAAVAAPPHESPPREGERGRVCCIECNKIGNAVRLLSFLDERDDRVVMNFSFFLFYTSFLSLFFFFKFFLACVRVFARFLVSTDEDLTLSASWNNNNYKPHIMVDQAVPQVCPFVFLFLFEVLVSFNVCR